MIYGIPPSDPSGIYISPVTHINSPGMRTYEYVGQVRIRLLPEEQWSRWISPQVEASPYSDL